MFANLLNIKTEIPYLHKYSGTSCFHWLSLMFLQLDWSPPVANSIDWTWFGKAHTCLYKGPTVDSACQSKNQAIRLKELSVEVRDRIVSRQRSGEGHQNISAALKVPKNTVASSFLNGRSLETSRNFIEPNWAIKGFGQGGDQEPDGHFDRALKFLCGDGRIFPKDNYLHSTPPIRP